MKKILFLILFIQIATVCNARVIVDKVQFKGKTYYVDLVVNRQSVISVWFRASGYAVSPKDLLILTLKVSEIKYQDAKKLICRSASVYDNYQTISGCISTVASGACAYGMRTPAALYPNTVAYCSAVWNYSLRTGMGNCVDGVSGKIADYASKSIWADFAAKMGLSRARLSDITNVALKNVCRDAK